MHMLSSKCAPRPPGERKRLSAVRVLTLLVLASGVSGTLGATGCIWLDDFGKFKIGDAGPERDLPDGQTGLPESDAAAGGDAETSERCRDVDCSDLDKECMKGVCDPGTGECTTRSVADGEACFDGNPCTFSDSCKAGACSGQALDCSALDDECSDGMCDPETGGCKFGPNQASQPCDDANACTVNDRCTDDPDERCAGEDAPAGASCTDFETCTGTDAEPDACNGTGRCIAGGPVAEGTTCDDESNCTAADKCDGEGFCVGTPEREGQPCNEDCTSNTTCRAGRCIPSDDDVAPTYDSQCLFSFCGATSICQEKWKTDLVCHCGCGYEDPACSPCSPYMCQAHDGHEAARWCDDSGKPATNCPDSLKGDGKCDCGCQFDDPDCNGGDCCSGTGEAGCGDSYVEDCVCQNGLNGDSTCCSGEWTDRCAQLAVNLGCMLCPER
jgi:hypothetical protein